ncbi:MAG: TetR/AcrR family transcriptional regulator [Hyphomonadaceae bacterium]|nr:TetR/AcrR family transcriptional regulator [Hyphomonadaceae bacterium]
MTKAKRKPGAEPAIQGDDVRSDGRRRRSDANRRRIAQALIDLAIDGDIAPSAERVAERAGVGRRTVFRLFSDMEGVYSEAHALMIARLGPIIHEAVEGATWRERLDQLIDRRVRLFEEILPIKTASDARRAHSPFLQEGHAEFTRLLRGVLMFVAPKSVSEDRTLFEAVELALSFETWRRLRHEQRLSAKSAGAVVRRLVDALLD